MCWQAVGQNAGECTTYHAVLYIRKGSDLKYQFLFIRNMMYYVNISWLPLRQRKIFKIATFMHQNGLAPPLPGDRLYQIAYYYRFIIVRNRKIMSHYPWAVYCVGPPSFIWRGREGGGKGREGQKNWGTLSRGFGLKSFRPEISAWGVFVGRRFRPGRKSRNLDLESPESIQIWFISDNAIGLNL